MASLQQLILDILDEQGTISDTRSIVIDGAQAVSQEAQLTILGALNSLLSREVCRVVLCKFDRLILVALIGLCASRTNDCLDAF